MRSFFFVVFSYVSKAAVKIDRKLEEGDEEKAVGAAWDMVLVEESRLEGRAPADVWPILLCLMEDVIYVITACTSEDGSVRGLLELATQPWSHFQAIHHISRPSTVRFSSARFCSTFRAFLSLVAN